MFGSDKKRSPSTAQAGREARRAIKNRKKRGRIGNDAFVSNPLESVVKSEPPKVTVPSGSFIKSTDIIRVKGSPDMIMLVTIIILTMLGLIMDFSASYAYANTAYGDSLYYIRKQFIFAIVGIVVMLAMVFFRWFNDYTLYKKFTLPVYVVSIILLVLVLAVGLAKGDAQRWINVPGTSFTIQPSEIGKLAIVMMMALYVSQRQDDIIDYENKAKSFRSGIILPGVIIGIPIGLVFLESHYSCVIIMGLIGISLMFVAGSDRKVLLIGMGAAVFLLFVFILFKGGYALNRIDMWLFPEKQDPTGTIWQTLQGLYAIGSGGLFGVGLGNSKQKYLFVSQPQNDFVFSIVCEELGFAGATLVIVLFILLMWRGYRTAMRAPDTYSSLLAFGITFKLTVQTALNIAVVTNTIPNTGISLPFFSYGGTALLMQLGEMGILLIISKYTYREVRPRSDT
ncbi:MAG: FtsW/RodA/SpoVE family cell cycle protein [Firmicutes bacterium]|nr:FtsW/RodA/SpoVE family cell cycle protein [Candidatus Colimorpha enterica]